uniref:Uncharacterized protein n=1 Tax=Arundo donax TaxID=35708 RepID=A0A0A9EH36_ARUDO
MTDDSLIRSFDDLAKLLWIGMILELHRVLNRYQNMHYSFSWLKHWYLMPVLASNSNHNYLNSMTNSVIYLINCMYETFFVFWFN